MDKKKLLILLISLVVVLVLTPLGVIIAQRQVERSKEQKKIENLNATTFASQPLHSPFLFYFSSEPLHYLIFDMF